VPKVTAPRRLLSRRRFLVGSALAAGAGTAGVLYAATSRSGTTPPPRTPLARPPSTASPAATPPPSGGVARLAAPARLAFDTFDPTRTGEPTVFEVLGRTHSRLVQWTDFAAPAMAGDLAANWEQPDPLTLILRLSPAARWHDRPPVNGRPVVAADVAAHFARLLSQPLRPPLLQRRWDFGNVRRVTAPDERTVVFEVASPDPFLLHTLAARTSVITAPEAVAAFDSVWHEAKPSQVIGSGPFIYEGREGESLRFTAHRAGHTPAYLDGLVISSPFRSVERFLSRELDEVLTRDRRDAAAVREQAPAAVELAQFEDSPLISTFFVGAPPWNNVGLRRALSAALDRQELSRRLFGARAAAAGPVPPAFASFLPPEADLLQFPGYRDDFPRDATEARRLWDAAGGGAYPELLLDLPSIFDPLYSASSVVSSMLTEVLGVTVKPAVETYTTIAEKARTRSYGNGRLSTWFGWGPPIFEPDPSRQLIETYHSGSAAASELGFASPAIDRILDHLSLEFDLDRRRALVRELHLKLLSEGGGGTLNWLQQQAEMFRWPYLGGTRPPSTLPLPHTDAALFLDRSHPSYAVRPR
jgi:peptide/nickel transport system substrate-binding protein